jgi:hypothetical protein
MPSIVFLLLSFQDNIRKEMKALPPADFEGFEVKYRGHRDLDKDVSMKVLGW